MRNLIITLAMSIFLLTGCSRYADEDASGLATKVAEQVVPAKPEYRALRVCLLAAGIVEVMTDRIQTFDGTRAPDALGRLMALQGAIDTARMASPMWMNTDMADVSFQFAKVLKDAGREKLGRGLLGGASILNFINIAERTALAVSKGDALLLDINAMMRGVNDGTIPEADVWLACENRIAQNRRVLGTLSGARMQ